MVSKASEVATGEVPSERELTAPTSLCLPDGRLDPQAVGWSRRPLHTCNLRGRWGRKKRWDYWCVTTRDFMLALTYADVDYLGLASAAFLNFRDRRWLERTAIVPLAVGFAQADTVGGADLSFDRFGVSLSMTELDGGTQLRCAYRARSGERISADVLVALPPEHETVNVVVPWNARTFQFTSKHNTRPATGHVTVDGRRHDIGPDNDGFGCLDFGRGIWPYRTVWNWGSASGVCNGTTIGLQLGGIWTDGTGATENGVCIDGRVSKISDRVDFRYDRNDFKRPWRIVTPESDRIALSFTPFFKRRVLGDARLFGGALATCFGHYSGTVVDDSGQRLAIDDLVGWAEEVRVRW